jgi:hypothetical protein
LCVSNKKLFCSACWEELSIKSSVVENHVRSLKHTTSKKNRDKNEAGEKEIAELLRLQDEVTHPKGETLPEDQRIFCVKVVTAF